jgi:hypothetical protein
MSALWFLFLRALCGSSLRPLRLKAFGVSPEDLSPRKPDRSLHAAAVNAFVFTTCDNSPDIR